MEPVFAQVALEHERLVVFNVVGLFAVTVDVKERIIVHILII